MKNNIEFAQVGSGAEGTHVQQDVPTCGVGTSDLLETDICNWKL